MFVVSKKDVYMLESVDAAKKNVFFQNRLVDGRLPILFKSFYEWVSDDWWDWWWLFDGFYECFFFKISISSEEKFKGKPDMVSSASIESNSFFSKRFGGSIWILILLTSVQPLKMVWSSDFKCVLAVFFIAPKPPVDIGWAISVEIIQRSLQSHHGSMSSWWIGSILVDQTRPRAVSMPILFGMIQLLAMKRCERSFLEWKKRDGSYPSGRFRRRLGNL